MAGKKINKNERYMLKGRRRKEGFEHWRLVTSATNTQTGVERVFFIEFFVVNPLLSPDNAVLGFKSRVQISEEDLHLALAGTSSAMDLESETLVQPSFVMVKGGIFKENGKQINAYFPSSNIQPDNQELLFKVGTDESNFCSLTTSSSYGSVKVSKEDLEDKPELKCQVGQMSWNLRYVKNISFPGFKNKGLLWSVPGAKTIFEGKIFFDDEEYEVNPSTSCGYFETCWGKDLFENYYHLSSSKLTSLNTGKVLEDSCIVVQGLCDEMVAVYVAIDGKKYTFTIGKAKRSELTFDFSEIPDEEEGITKFHWSVSISDKKYIIDIDGYCTDKSMFLRDYESPEGKRKVLRIAGSGTGSGEVKIYKKVKKSLEQLEFIKMENLLCEFGNIETSEDSVQ